MEIMPYYGNNGIWINIKYSKLSGKFITIQYLQRMRLESQAKLHRIVTKAHKIICFNHTKISTYAIFFDARQNFVDPHDPAKVWLTLPTNLGTHTNHAI